MDDNFEIIDMLIFLNLIDARYSVLEGRCCTHFVNVSMDVCSLTMIGASIT